MKNLQGWWDSDLSPHLKISTPAGDSLDLVVDSGFNGELMMSVSLIKKLGLTKSGTITNILADGSLVQTATYAGEILWFGQKKNVWVQATNSDEGLLGTELFQGCVVEMAPDEDRVVFRKKSSKARRRSKGGQQP
jgi:clan AA aspartic protease